MTKPKLEWISLRKASRMIEQNFPAGIQGGNTLLGAIKTGLLSVRGYECTLSDADIDSGRKPAKSLKSGKATQFKRSQAAPKLQALDQSENFGTISRNMIVLRDGARPNCKVILAFAEIKKFELDSFAFKSFVWPIVETEGRSRIEKAWITLLVTLLSIERHGLLDGKEMTLNGFSSFVIGQTDDIVNASTCKRDLSIVHALFFKDGGKLSDQTIVDGKFNIHLAFKLLSLRRSI